MKVVWTWTLGGKGFGRSGSPTYAEVLISEFHERNELTVCDLNPHPILLPPPPSHLALELRLDEPDCGDDVRQLLLDVNAGRQPGGHLLRPGQWLRDQDAQTARHLHLHA